MLVHVDGNLTHGLRGIGMEDHAALVAELADFGHRLQHANFVVGEHDRHQDGFVIHGALQIFEVNLPVLLHRQIGDAVIRTSPAACRCRAQPCAR